MLTLFGSLTAHLNPLMTDQVCFPSHFQYMLVANG